MSTEAPATPRGRFGYNLKPGRRCIAYGAGDLTVAILEPLVAGWGPRPAWRPQDPRCDTHLQGEHGVAHHLAAASRVAASWRAQHPRHGSRSAIRLRCGWGFQPSGSGSLYGLTTARLD